MRGRGRIRHCTVFLLITAAAISWPASAAPLLRQDPVPASARAERPGDEEVSIPASGFNLAATLSKPSASPAAPWPAVILTGTSAAVDRDETAGGVPIFAELASVLADAGFLVARYDRRGTGKSGGRPESATLSDYADDVRAVLKYIARRKDVDSKRLALAGYGDGGSVALMAASNDNRVRALILVATAASAGSELVLEQQQRALARSAMPAAEKQAAIDLQRRLVQAAVSGSGWEDIPADMRRRVDTAWYRSWLLFNPADIVRKTSQPVLILHGDLDEEIAAFHADRLAELARQRKAKAAAELRRLASVNHFLGEANDSGSDHAVASRRISPQVTAAIDEWLKKTLRR